jgi:hypothetical protein
MDLVALKSSVLACIDSPPPSVFVDVGGWWGAHSQPPPFSGKQSGGQQAEANSTELELELLQTHMTQKPMLRVEVGARVCAQVKNM